jgi:hypothetical protein
MGDKKYNVSTDLLESSTLSKSHAIDELIKQWPEIQPTPPQVCGPNQYVSVPDIITDTYKESCRECNTTNLPIYGNLEDYLGPSPKYKTKPQDDDVNYTNDKEFWENNRSPLELGRMCHTDPDIWIPAQYEANPYSQPRSDIDWSNLTVTQSAKSKDLYSQWFDDRKLDDTELQQLYAYHKGTSGRTGDLPSYITSFKEFKQDISKDRGSIVPCATSTSDLELWSGLVTRNPTIKLMDQCTEIDNTKFIGPNYINRVEYEEWSMDILHKQLQDNDLKSKESTVDWSQFSKDIGPPNPGFENCMNNIFEDKHGMDLQMTQDIKQLTHFREFKSEHIQHIKRKLGAFLLHSNHKEIIKCIDSHLYFNEPMCNAGIHTKLIKILSIILYIIGYNLKFNDIQFDTDKQKLMEIIDTLGPLVPRVFEHIISISEIYETQNCNGIKNSTTLLKELYENVFNPTQPHVSLNLGLSDLTSEKTSDPQFNRSTILAVLGIAFLKYF